jgi:hypothetical protein
MTNKSQKWSIFPSGIQTEDLRFLRQIRWSCHRFCSLVEKNCCFLVRILLQMFFPYFVTFEEGEKRRSHIYCLDPPWNQTIFYIISGSLNYRLDGRVSRSGVGRLGWALLEGFFKGGLGGNFEPRRNLPWRQRQQGVKFFSRHEKLLKKWPLNPLQFELCWLNNKFK